MFYSRILHLLGIRQLKVHLCVLQKLEFGIPVKSVHARSTSVGLDTDADALLPELLHSSPSLHHC